MQEQFVQFNLNSILMVAVGVLMSTIGYLIARTLKQIDINQSLLFDRLRDMELDMQKLQTEHDIIMCKERREKERREKVA